MIRTELLAPAKNKDIAFAAIDCGADAIYIGAYSFGARQNAQNSLNDISDVVKYAHKFYVKVFVTVNTILTDNELSDAVKLVKELDKIGVDAVLIQDFGLLQKLMSEDIKMPIHASTQCDNRTSEKVKFLGDIGFSRVVLARELSLKQIQEIHDNNPEIELEAFVHGALCVSYSGQCYLSHYIGGRSANRGVCAQPCRKKYTVTDNKNNIIAKDIYALCLKDFNASNHIKDMIDAGIYSFKIEGRLKDINYVKNIVAYYRNQLDRYSQKSSSGVSYFSFIPDSSKSFNRGFTIYFLKEREECWNYKTPKSVGKYLGKVIGIKKHIITIQTDEILSPQDGICYISEFGPDGFFVNRVVSNKNSNVVIEVNKIPKIKVGDILYRNVDVEFEKSLSLPVKRQIGVKIQINSDYITITDEDNNNVSIKMPDGEKPNNQQKMNNTFIKQFSKTGESDFYIIDFNLFSDVPFLPIAKINELRRDILEKLMQLRLSKYKRILNKSIKYAPFYKESVDYKANIHNSEAKEFYEKCGAKVLQYSFEREKPKQQIELMRTKHCIKYMLNLCKSNKKLFLHDDKGVKYPLKFDCANCEMVVLSPK